NENEYFGAQFATFVEIQPVKNLTIKSVVDGMANVSQRNDYNPKFYLAADSRALESILSSSTSQNTRWKITTTANYVATVANDHKFDVLVGHSVDNYAVKGTSAERRGIPFDTEPHQYIPA